MASNTDHAKEHHAPGQQRSQLRKTSNVRGLTVGALFDTATVETDVMSLTSIGSVECSGWLLASPVGRHKGRTDWLLSPSANDKRASHRGVAVVVVVVVVVVEWL